jgi:hypothetical protein
MSAMFNPHSVAITHGRKLSVFWALITKSLLTSFQIRALWLFATTSISMMFQNRHVWNYVYSNETPMIGVYIYRTTLEKYLDVITNPTANNDVLSKCTYETLSQMDMNMFTHACFVVEYHQLLPVYYQMKCPCALRFLANSVNFWRMSYITRSDRC